MTPATTARRENAAPHGCTGASCVTCGDDRAELVRAELLSVALRHQTHGLASAAMLLAVPTLETWAAIAADFAAARRPPHRPLHAEGLAATAMARADVDSAVALLAHAEGLSSPEWVAARSGRR